MVLIFILALLGLSFGQLSVRIPGDSPTQFILGEKAFVPVFIDGVSGNGSTEHEQGVTPYVLENVSGNADWLKPNGRPAYNSSLDNAYYHWQNNQNFWLELSGFPPAAGTYSGTLRVRNTATGESQNISYSFSVINPPSNYYGVVIAMHDSAASYRRQMEIYTSLKNTATAARTLQSPYIDYYATRMSGRQPVVNVWKKPSNGCVQVLDCGQGNFVIRHRFSGEVSIGAGARSGEFQVGYNEVAGSTDPYYYSSLQDKDIWAFLDVNQGYIAATERNAYVDYSAFRWATNYTARAMQRNLFYNQYEALYDHSGNRLWGTAPSWFSEQGCHEVRMTTATSYNWQKFRTNSGISGFCTEGLVNTSPVIQFSTSGPDTIYEGEDYFMRPLVTDVDGDDFTMELVGPHPSWIEVGTPADYWDDYENVIKNNVNTATNRKVFYIRSRHGDIRKTAVKPTGSYTYTVKVTDSYGGSSTATRTVVVVDGSLHPSHTPSGLAVLVGDETWFKRYQLDVASGVVNYSGTSRTLSAGWRYDYYGVHAERPFSSSLPSAHYWYTDPNVDVSYEACGNGKFRLRYTGKTAQIFLANRSYQDSKVGFVYGISMNKVDDWSIGDFYAGGDTLRRRQYAPKAPLYDGDGTLLWGEAPSWAADCGDNSSSSSSSLWSSSSTTGQSSSSVYPPNSSSNPISSSSVQPVSSSSIPVSSSSAVSSSTALSSSSFNPYTDLLIRFSDNSTSTGAANLKLYVVNKGNATANIGGYELRFYYNGNENLDASRLVFENYQNSSAVQSKVTEQCEENLFVYKVKFSDDAQIQPGASAPPGGMDLAVHLDTWQNYDWHGFASWVDASEPTDNPNMALFDANGNLVYGTEMWPCNGYTKKSLKLTVNETVHAEGMGIPNGYVNDAVGNVSLEVRNDGDSSLVGPVYVDFYVTHPASHVPMLVIGTDTLSVAGTLMSLGDGIAASRTSSGNRHTFRFVLANGLPAAAVRNISFVLLDQCLTDCPSGSESVYTWSLADDWSAMDGIANPWNSVKTEKVAVYSSTGELVYGTPDPSSPTPPMQEIAVGDTVFSLTHPRTSLASQVANRTDAVLYSAGQMLSGGDFESDWLHGWNVSGSAHSARGISPQGSRHLELASGARITQALPLQAGRLLADSGAVLMLWHTGTLTVEISKNETSVNTNTVSGGGTWKRDTVFLAKSLFDGSSVYALSISANGASSLDDAILTAVTAAKPATYAVRFTNTAGEELESRAYDGAEELLVTDFEHDGMGRTWKKYLPFALPCKGAADCNSERKTAHNSGMAKSYYTASNPDYPDAGGVPYVETKWKPDPMATKDVEGAPGSAFGVTGVDGRMHLVKSYSSGVNLSGVNLLDSASLNSAVAAVRHGRAYDGDTNYRAARDANPTHLWELNTDQDGRRAFTVKDGEGRVIVSGSLDSTGKLLTRSVNELDSRGNVVKSHLPMSCGYTPRPANCVTPNEYGYDAQSRMVWGKEPDAGETRTFYDLMGRVRATQTQRQIDSGAYSVTVYDNLDRPIYTGEWKTALDSGAARAYFGNEQNQFNPTVAELTPGTVTRTFYDRMPTRDTLGVSLYSATVQADAFRYGRTRTVAEVSDVSADGSGNVVRVAKAYSYDKYGRVTATYAYDPTVPADSLKMLAVETEYDLGGKVTRTAKYPYGVDSGGASRKIVERYTYDRLGRTDSMFSKNGGGDEMLLAHYSYYPTGGVKTVTMGNSLTLTYTYHISGAVKTAAVQSADGNTLYSETLYYEDCGGNGCTPQYNGNISRMVHELAHGNADFGQYRDVAYAYDQLNRLTSVDDVEQDYFDEAFGYDAQGRIVAQRRDTSIAKNAGGEYAYYANTNRLKSVADGMGGTADDHNMSDANNFVYDSEGNLIEDKSKKMRITYDWRGMPMEFVREIENGDSLKLVMKYDGDGRRISKAMLRKLTGAAEWSVERTTRYTGIGTEIRTSNSDGKTKVVINMPQGLGRYAIEYADVNDSANSGFEWYLKNHLGSTMAVYRTTGTTAGPPMLQHAYDYRSYGEKINLTELTDKVTENFTGKELDDETELGYWGARYLDLMLGVWISVDIHKEFYNSYSYGPVNPINGYDKDGNIWRYVKTEYFNTFNFFNAFSRIVGEITRIGRITVVAAGINEESLLYSQRYIYHQWESLPNEDNLYQDGTIRKVLQTYIEKEQARRDFYNRNPDQVGVPQLWSDKPYQWAPLVPEIDTPDELNGSGFGVEYIEPDYNPDGNVDIGPIEIE